MAKKRGKVHTGKQHTCGRKQDEAKCTKPLLSKEQKLLKSKKSLSMAVNMPLDILCEIFKLLSPKDLVNLSNTSLMFRRTLSARSMSIIWKESREREEAPGSPGHVTERDWAVLLFSTLCTHCGSNHAKCADFSIRQRLCKLCRTTELVATWEVKVVDREVFDLIPSTGAITRRYYSSDIKQIQEKLVRLKNDAVKPKSIAHELTHFRAQRRQILVDFAHERDSLEAWQTNKNQQVKQESEDAFQVRYQEVKRRFADLRYTEEDLEDLNWDLEMHKLVRQKSRLTEKTWERIRQIFQPIMDATRQYSADLEVKKLRASRRDIVEKLYAQYKFTISPHLWKHLPSVYNICQLGSFDSLVKADPSVAVTEASFAACIDAIPRLIADAYEHTKSQLLQKVIAARHSIHDGIDFTKNFRQLELATMVFRCGSCRGLVLGFDSGVSTHNCSPGAGLSWDDFNEDLPQRDYFPHPFEFSAEGATATVQVLNAVGLDPKSATISQLTQKECAFRCVQCMHEHRNRAKYGFSWKGIISHAVDWHGPLIENETYLGCDLLPLEYMTEYKHVVEQGGGCRRWTCTHCTWYMIGKDCGRYGDVINHLEQHGIYDPTVGVDIVMMDQPCLRFIYAYERGNSD